MRHFTQSEATTMFEFILPFPPLRQIATMPKTPTIYRNEPTPKEESRRRFVLRPIRGKADRAENEGRIECNRRCQFPRSERSDRLPLGAGNPTTKNFRLAENCASLWYQKSKRRSTERVKNFLYKMDRKPLDRFYPHCIIHTVTSKQDILTIAGTRKVSPIKAGTRCLDVTLRQ